MGKTKYFHKTGEKFILIKRTKNNWLLLQSCETGQLIVSDGSDLTSKLIH